MKLNLGALKTLGGPKVQRAALKLSKYAPEILTGVGVVGVVASTILIARATTKLEPIVDTFEEGVREAKAYRDNDPSYAEDGYGKDLVHIYWRGFLDLGKIYAGPVILQAASLAAIIAGQGISHRRAVSILGAYKALEAGFNTYRQRVIDEYGEDKDRDFRTGFRTQQIEDKETGKKKKVRTFDPNTISPYARVFDRTNDNWQQPDEYNLFFLKSQQTYANDRLIARGHIFLNEIYDSLGFKRTTAGQSVGWVVGAGGDNFVDFNIYEDTELVNGKRVSRILLDFNVDGVILDLIEQKLR